MKACENCNVSMLRDHPESNRPELHGWLKCGFCGFCRPKTKNDKHTAKGQDVKHRSPDNKCDCCSDISE